MRSRLIFAAWNFLLADTANTYIITVAETSLNPVSSLAMYTLHCSTIVAWVCVTYGISNVQYSVLAAFSVAFGMSLPGDWPNVFGELADAYTLRRFWG